MRSYDPIRIWSLAMRNVFSMAVVLCLSMTSASEAFTGKDFKTACDSGDRYASGGSGFKATGDAYSGGECLGYVHGVNDALPQGIICPKEGITVGDEVNMVRAFMKQHPSRILEPAVDLVRESLMRAYPCSP